MRRDLTTPTHSLIRSLRIILLISLVSLSLTIEGTTPAHGVPYSMNYSLSISGVPFAGGAISLGNNFTNAGQLTIRVIGITIASDFWSNGTRQVFSRFPFNLTMGTKSIVDTPILIPASASIGDHTISSTASWQYSNSTGWHDASPVTAKIALTVSQTISSLFSGVVTILLIGLGVAVAATLLIVAILIMQRRRRSKSPQAP